MILALIILVPFAFVALWLFLRLSPKGVDKTKLRLFNGAVVSVGLILCGAVTFKIYSLMAGGPDRAWWPVLSVLASLIVFPSSLVLGGLVRNFLVFRGARITD